MKKLESLKSELFQSNDLMTRAELQANQGGQEKATCNEDSGNCDVMHSSGEFDTPVSRLNGTTGEDDVFIVDTACSEESGEDVNANVVFGGGISPVNDPIQASSGNLNYGI
mgnify:CR=1 FL=1|tara:strand:- start:3099 stop:3431 length:333 start_codon:yes stop_codon:yes gene_type:complete